MASTRTSTGFNRVSLKMPDLFASVTSMFDEAEKDFDTWKTSNKSLQSDIDDLRKLVRALTKSANEIHNECTKPREFTMKSDPSVKLRAGNTLKKVGLWEKQKLPQRQQLLLPKNVKLVKTTTKEDKKPINVESEDTGGSGSLDLCPQTHL